MAADGCTFTFTRNPDDVISFYGPDGKSTKGFNQIHTVALYDLISRSYVNAKIQPIKNKNEFKALAELIDDYQYQGLKPINSIIKTFEILYIFKPVAFNSDI